MTSAIQNHPSKTLTSYERELSPLEQGMEVLNRRASSFNVVTICRITGPLSEDILRQALDLLQSRHPRLNSRIVGELDSLYFKSGAMRIPLQVVEKQHDEQWQEVVVQELNQRIESNECLLRAVLVSFKSDNNVSYLITTIHHAISDRASSDRLHSEILTYCQKIASGEPIEQVASLPPLPPLQELLPKSMQGFTGVVNVWSFLSRSWFKRIWHRPETLNVEKCVPVELRRCGMTHRRLNEEQTAQLVNCCRKKKTTVQGALCAVMLFVAAKKISGGKKTDVRVSCGSAINLRKRLKPVVSEENMGALASHIISYHTIGTNTSFWDLARDVRQQLEVGLESNDIFSRLLFAKKFFESILASPSKTGLLTVSITNIGRVNIPQIYDPFELEEISGAVAYAAFGDILAATVSTFQGKMLLNFMFSDPAFNLETMEVLANNVLSCIVDACTNEKLTFALWSD
ncbi:alcohol acetyltransferase [Nostoc sp. FACHB-892]|uniref:phthiocerol/phthiodiolone dimycocerosyl transferase family protein n=1 Tax=Nostoc sp. FACHB-892 TaxID=2692843 RepID=UPI001688304F|nr:condensation domain-containing protein [Nostoc sp. FACHB-892]MBD2729715.1 alcohol acetyltransferase [Nostoc sp. FACHB-892]